MNELTAKAVFQMQDFRITVFFGGLSYCITKIRPSGLNAAENILKVGLQVVLDPTAD